MNAQAHFKSPTLKTTSHNGENLKKTGTINLIVLFLWLLFTANTAFLIVNYDNPSIWEYDKLLRINRFTCIIWVTVSFFSAIIGTYARNYLKGFRYHSRFMGICLIFTGVVMVLVLANNVFIFLASWTLMGILMSQLIGIDKAWREAQAASRFTRSYFLTGSLFLAGSLALLVYGTQSFSISEIAVSADTLPRYISLPAALLLIAAAVVQSAIYPFHRWLLSAMTAPTPASALMHAGFVNGSGILLSLFASVLFTSDTLTLLFIIGGLTAIIAQFAKLLQVYVKQKLACSTIAQMGFMIMQCGLGFFNAAVAHLILHGFYKAYLFLASGEEIEQTQSQKPLQLKIKPVQAVVVLLFGILGAGLFAWATGKGLHADSGIFLTLVVAITVGQATYNILKEQSLTRFQKVVVPPVLFLTGIGLYALAYNGVTFLMQDLPMIDEPLALSWPQIIFGIIFLVGFFAMKLGLYNKLPWLYVKLLNLSQSHHKSILLFKSKI